jgi:hypothetical protein
MTLEPAALAQLPVCVALALLSYLTQVQRWSARHATHRPAPRAAQSPFPTTRREEDSTDAM